MGRVVYFVQSDPRRGNVDVCRFNEMPMLLDPGTGNLVDDEGGELEKFMAVSSGECPDQSSSAYVRARGVSDGVFRQIMREIGKILTDPGFLKQHSSVVAQSAPDYRAFETLIRSDRRANKSFWNIEYIELSEQSAILDSMSYSIYLTRGQEVDEWWIVTLNFFEEGIDVLRVSRAFR